MKESSKFIVIFGCFVIKESCGILICICRGCSWCGSGYRSRSRSWVCCWSWSWSGLCCWFIILDEFNVVVWEVVNFIFVVGIYLLVFIDYVNVDD